MEESDKKIHWYERLPHEAKDQPNKKTIDKDTVVEIQTEKYGQDLKKWLQSIAQMLGIQKREDVALQALRAVLHTLRDRMPIGEVFDLSAQLPTLIRGIYFENYRLNDKPEKINLQELLHRIDEQMVVAGDDLSSEKVFKAVLKELHTNISSGELKDVYNAMPKDIKKYWDDCIQQ